MKRQFMYEPTSVNCYGMPALHTPEGATASAICEIPLDMGQVALCDEEDFEFLSRFRWWIRPKRNGYRANTVVGGQAFSMHQLVLLLDKPCWVIHRDGNILNNCRSNLHLATVTLFAATRTKATARVYSSQYKGVSLKKKGNDLDRHH